MFLAGAVKDPAVQDTVIHAVRVSGDLQHARVYVRFGTLEPRPARIRALMKGLSRASGFLRGKLGKKLQLRYTPTLTFEWDDTAEKAARIETLLEEIQQTETATDATASQEGSEPAEDPPA